jgi:hypothetical protein
MSLSVAGKRLSIGDLVLGGGLLVGVVSSLLTWRSAAIPPGYACDIPRQCAAESAAFNDGHGGLVYWPGWVFLAAVIIGLVLLSLRTFLPHVAISPMPSTDAPVYAGISAVMLLCALLGLLTGVGGHTEYYETSAGGVYTLGPGIGIFIGIVAAVAVGVGGFLMRAKRHPASRQIGPGRLPVSPAGPPS